MKLHEQLGIDLDTINLMLREVLESDESLSGSADIREHALALIDAGGKRLRPIMTIVGGRFGDAERLPYVMRAATVLEYIHTASLIHDDIIDNSALRRGRPTLHTRVGIPKAVFIANYMMARAVEWAAESVNAPTPQAAAANAGQTDASGPSPSPFPEQGTAMPPGHSPSLVHGAALPSGHSPASAAPLSASDQDFQRIAELASLITELCLGEYGQLRDRFNFDLTLEQYLDKTKKKTALLMAHCLRAGAEAAGADRSTAELLYRFGETLGIAFQIRDDVLDFTEPEEAIGKPAGADLRNGNMTLPVLFALEHPALAERIRSLHAHSSDAEFAEAIAEIAASGAVERARSFALSYTAQAEAIATELSAHPASVNLLPLLHYFTE